MSHRSNLKMDFFNFEQKESILNKQLPNCMSKPYCNCFNDLLQLKIPNEDPNLYVFQSINQIEYFIHLAEIHRNKECVIEVFYSSKISALELRRVVHFMSETRRKFHLLVQSEKKDCFIDFPNKSIPVKRYLGFVSLYCSCLDSMIEMSMYPTSEVNVLYLNQILHMHLNLLFIFEQYLNVKKYGFSFSTRTISGTNNCFQLFFL